MTLPLIEPTPQCLPRWRGFNLLNHFSKGWSDRPFLEDEFRLIHDLGFDFVRLPLDYRVWVQGDNWDKIDLDALREVDRAVEWGRRCGLHVCVCFHRAPGYCINPPVERESLWASQAARRACAKHWALFAGRYKGLPNREVSFNLFNEPTGVDNATYAEVCGVMCDAIRAVDPDRLILCDGNEAGTLPVEELISWRVAQCTRGYQPFRLTHYRAPWVVGSDAWPVPAWPMKASKDGEGPMDASWLQANCIEPWKRLEAKGVGVMVGEWGVYRQTPHDVTLRFMEDLLSLWKTAGWGWALWNLTGDFGPFESGRADVAYETFLGRPTDRAMLDLLRGY